MGLMNLIRKLNSNTCETPAASEIEFVNMNKEFFVTNLISEEAWQKAMFEVTFLGSGIARLARISGSYYFVCDLKNGKREFIHICKMK
jgi:hypothetical protein